MRLLLPLPIDAPRAVAALTRFMELTEADRRDRALRDLQRDLQARMDAGLRAQRGAFRSGLAGLKAKFQDPLQIGAIWAGDWVPYFDAAVQLTRARMERGLYDNILSALLTGGGHLVDDVGVPLTIAFNLDNPRAVAWALEHAAAQVTRINLVTMQGINSLIVDAVTNGWSYTRTAKMLQEMFEFSPGRAQRIAVYETGAAYEQGKKLAAQEMTAQGLRMEKSWLSAGDEKVRPSHRANQAQGWIGMDDTFPSGHELAPTDPGCRCAVLWRMAQ